MRRQIDWPKKGGQQLLEKTRHFLRRSKNHHQEEAEKNMAPAAPRTQKTNYPYYLLSKTEQVCIVRLRTGHSRILHHMHTKFRIGESSVCPCGTASMTVKHLRQDCSTHRNLRIKIWPVDQPLREKLYGSL